MSNPSKFRILIAILLVSTMLIGCGGDNAPAASNPTTAPAPAANPSPTQSSASSGSTSNGGDAATYDEAYGNLAFGFHYFHFVQVWQRTSKNVGTTTTEGDVDAHDKTVPLANLTLSNSDIATDNGQWARANHKWYHKVDGKWQESNYTPSTGGGDDVLNPENLLQHSFGSDQVSYNLVGSDTVEGQDCNHYQAIWKGDTYDAWISKQTSLFVRMEKTRPDYALTITFSKVDQPVTLDLPK